MTKRRPLGLVLGLMALGLAGCLGLPKEVVLDTVSRDEQRCEMISIPRVFDWQWSKAGTGYGAIMSEPRLVPIDPVRKETALVVRGYWMITPSSEYSKNCYRFNGDQARPIATDCKEWERADNLGVPDSRVPKPWKPATSPSGRYLSYQDRQQEVKSTGWLTTYTIYNDSLKVTDRASGKDVMSLKAKPSVMAMTYFWIGNSTRDMIVILMNDYDVLAITFNDESKAQ